MKEILILFLLPLFFMGCSREPLPFEAEYTSRNSVTVTFEGNKYILLRHAPTIQTPFTYAFEPDGDLDLVINGKSYEVDSPYDVDSKKKKKKKPVKKSSKKKKK